MAAQIKNIFVLLLENRSFDHMLGFSGISGVDAESGSQTRINGLQGAESNAYQGATYTVAADATDPLPVDPGHEFLDVLEQLCGATAAFTSGQPYPPINNSGFVSDYAVSHTRDEGNATGDYGRIMSGFAPADLPVLKALAAVPPGDTAAGSKYNQYGFNFDRYGVRVPAVVVSPFIPANTIDHRLYDHSSIPATVEAAFGMAPLT